MTLEQELLRIVETSLVIPKKQTMVEWCKENVYLPEPPFKPGGQLDLTLSPYLIQPAEDMLNPALRMTCLVGPPRSGKTMVGQAYALYRIKEQPADILLSQHKKNSLKELFDVRIMPLFKANKVGFADERFNSTQRLIKFALGSMKLTGAKTDEDFTQLGHEVAIGDELHKWAEGMLSSFKQRQSEFPYTKKCLLISQAAPYESDWHKEWLKGTQMLWGFKCPQCNTEQIYHFHYKRPDGKYAGLRFDEIKDSKDKCDIPATAETARYECIHCLQKFGNNQKDRWALNKAGLYISQNPKPEPTITSYSYNALTVLNVSFADIVNQYLYAKKGVDRNLYKDIENFHLQVLSNWYHPGLTDEKLELTVGDTQEDGPDGLRFMGVDVQKFHLYYVILAYFKEKKEIRLVTYGRIDRNWPALNKLQLEHRVSYKNVLVDSGDDTTDVYRACAENYKEYIDAASKKKRRMCWCATKGDEPAAGDYYHVRDKISRLYSPISKKEVTDPKTQTKTFCKLTLFATSPVRTILQELIEKKHPHWKLFFSPEAAADAEFNAHLNVDKPITTFSPRSNKAVLRWVNAKNDDNHYADALNLCTLAGVICGFL